MKSYWRATASKIREDISDAKHRKGNGRHQSEALEKKRYSIPLAVWLYSCLYRPEAVNQRHLPIRSKFVFLFHKNLPAAFSTRANLLFVPVGSKRIKAFKDLVYYLEVVEMVLETKKKTGFLLAEKENKNKGGAPRKPVKRELDIRVRLSATERFMMDTKANEAGIKTSDWVRAAIKSAKVVQRLQAEELGFLRMLAGLANNLNQLMKLAYRQGLLSVAGKCRDLLSEIDHTLKSINNDRQDCDR